MSICKQAETLKLIEVVKHLKKWAKELLGEGKRELGEKTKSPNSLVGKIKVLPRNGKWFIHFIVRKKLAVNGTFNYKLEVTFSDDIPKALIKLFRTPFYVNSSLLTFPEKLSEFEVVLDHYLDEEIRYLNTAIK
ncbi:MAG: hypothetical protein M0R77_00765 [Gammaproteobacteria bacterium]|nr:hypothetical protein [Acholeplasmataceae bacterium]MCK9529086.1 hypothetical protein [Gammaproteobacteria bacterium]